MGADDEYYFASWMDEVVCQLILSGRHTQYRRIQYNIHCINDLMERLANVICGVDAPSSRSHYCPLRVLGSGESEEVHLADSGNESSAAESGEPRIAHHSGSLSSVQCL